MSSSRREPADLADLYARKASNDATAAREFAEKLIRERLRELVSAVQTAAPSVVEEEEKQNWEEVG